jgi:hypothetical protein
MAEPTSEGQEPASKNAHEPAMIHKAGAILGILTLGAIWAFEVIGPSAVAGMEPSGSRDPTVVAAYFAHGALAPLAVLSCLSGLSFLAFVLAVRETLSPNPVARVLGSLVAGLAAVEVGAIFLKSALRASIVSTVAAGGNPMPAFFLYDNLWNSMVYLLEGAFLFTISLALLREGRGLSWVAKLGLAAGAVQVANAALLPLGVGPAAALPGNLLFSAWFVAVSSSLWRRASGVGETKETPPGGPRAPSA